MSNEKIIIYRDGNHVLAKHYEGNNFKKQAYATCSPDDVFDFMTGAKLAFERLMKEDKPVCTHEYKIGDRVKGTRGIGTVICVSENHNFGIEYDEECGGHDCGSVKLISGKRGKHGHCWWEGEHNIEPYKDKPVFDWTLFKAGKFAVNCDTEEKAKAFLRECDKQGIKWRGGSNTTSHTNWEHHKEITTYDFSCGGLGYADTEWAAEKGIPPIPSPFPADPPKVKTYADDFFSKLPNAKTGDDGTPRVCRNNVYGGKSCGGVTCSRNDGNPCCWDEPYPETR